MELELLRISTEPQSTNGILFNKLPDGSRKFLCYIIEDTYRKEKVMHETRVPANRYQIKFRKVGGFNSRYTERYKDKADFHHGMLELQNVENENMSFKYVLIHCGNSSKSSSGCLITTFSQESNVMKPEGWGSYSRIAYEYVYPIISNALLNDKEVWINIINFEDQAPLSNKASDDVMLTTVVDRKMDKIITELSGIKQTISKHNII